MRKADILRSCAQKVKSLIFRAKGVMLGGNKERAVRAMEWLKKNYKTVTGTLIILILIEVVVAWYLIEQFRQNYLSGEEALTVALTDAGLSREDAGKTDIDLKTRAGSAWYEIEIDAEGGTLRYRIDAETGAILP